MSIICKGLFGIKIPYNGRCIFLLQQIAGVTIDTCTQTWWIPVDKIYQVADVLRPFFPNIAERLLTSPRFQEVRDIIKQKQETIRKSSIIKADIEIPKPEGLDYKNYQYGGISFAYDLWKNKKHGVLIGDDMGLGKTIQALGFINKIRPDLGRTPKVLIICPASIKMNWYREAKKWIVPATSTIVIESGIPAQAIKHHNICIINYDILTKYEKAIIPIDWDVIVYDESHYMKNDKAKRSRAGNIFSKMSDFVVLLTGTPITNKPIDLWHQLNIIDWDMFKSRSTFVDRFCGGAQGIGATNLDELQELLRSTYMVRRMKDDVLTELPPKVRQIVEVSRRGFERVLEEESKYLSIVKKYETQMDELEATRRINNMTEEEFKKEAARLRSGKLGDMGEIARIRHQTALAKVPKVVDFVKDVLENRDKVIVFAHHRDVIEQIANEFKGESVVLYGGMSTGEKDASVQAFMKNPKIRVFVASIVAAGVGLTLTASDTVIFAEESWNPSDISQAEDRAHRIGQQNTVFVYHLVVEGSIDSYIMNKIISKQEVIDQSINTVIE